MRVLTMKCVSCGASLEISPDMDRFSCSYCGSEQVVERRGGTVLLKPLTDAIHRVQAGTDKTAAELALKRMKEELGALNVAYQQRIGQARVEKNKTTPAIVGIMVVAGVFACALIKEIGCPGILVIFAIAFAASFFIYRKAAGPVNEALEADSARLRNDIQNLERRIAEKKKFADSELT